jgi:hypothetical protein
MGFHKKGLFVVVAFLSLTASTAVPALPIVVAPPPANPLPPIYPNHLYASVPKSLLTVTHNSDLKVWTAQLPGGQARNIVTININNGGIISPVQLTYFLAGVPTVAPVSFAISPITFSIPITADKITLKFLQPTAVCDLVLTICI